MATRINYTSFGLEKYTFVNLVCDGYERRHYTGTPGVYALCRACAKLILTELVERINYETDMYNSYTTALGSASDSEWAFLADSIRTSANNAKSAYTRYTAIATDLKSAKLSTSDCAMCASCVREN